MDVNVSFVVDTNGTDSGYMGGVVGYNEGGKVSRCYMTGSVDGSWEVGGLVGSNDGSVTDCYSSGAVRGQDVVGGLVGFNSRGTVASCYCTGTVRGMGMGGFVGGLVGYSQGEVVCCVWDMQTSDCPGSAGGVGLTTTEMMDPYMLGLNGFANDPDWVLDVGRDYPRLAWESTPGQIVPEADIDWSEGAGTLEDPYPIDRPEQIIRLGKASILCDSHFVLTADIDLDPNLPNGCVFAQAVIPRFAGVFDGGSHNIRHLTITGGSCLGLFGQLATGANVKYLAVVDANITGAGSGVGTLVGDNKGAIIQCHSTGVVVGIDAGLIGGLVGYNRGTVTQCYSTVAVTGTGWSGAIGGLAGNNSGAVTQSYSDSAVVGRSFVGGLVGDNFGTLTQCYSTSAVTGMNFVGGLVGDTWNLAGTVYQCYSTGTVNASGDYVGGLAGGFGASGIVGSFWNTETSGQPASVGGTGLTTAQMQTVYVFQAWATCGNESMWTIDEGKDYPRLWWENRPGEPIGLRGLSDLLIGIGAQDDPFLIYTPEELNMVGLYPCEWDKHFKLMADIDLSGFDGEQGRFRFNAIATGYGPAFSGIFDGNSHTISHLTVRGQDYLGLFGRLASGATVKDLGLADVSIISSGIHVGALVGCNLGLVTRCYSTGVVSSTSSCIGGLVGSNGGNYSEGSGTISNCHSDCLVSGSGQGSWTDGGVGGLVGWNRRGNVTCCYSNAVVDGIEWVGGLVGWNYAATVTCSYSGGVVSGISSVGGLVGTNAGTVIGSYSTGAVSGQNVVGGLVGDNLNLNGVVTQCYSTGPVSGVGWYVGGLTGGNWGDLTRSFWDIETSGQTTSGGGTGKTTAEMQTASTFLDAGWDFVGETANGIEDIWWILEGQGYPKLSWEAK